LGRLQQHAVPARGVVQSGGQRQGRPGAAWALRLSLPGVALVSPLGLLRGAARYSM